MMFNVNGRIWIESIEGMLIGEGRIKLLEKINEHNSIAGAAKAMKMSYRQAWAQVEVMNSTSNKPLVIKTSGGIGGGGTIVTEHGIEMIKFYHEALKKFTVFLKSMSIPKG